MDLVEKKEKKEKTKKIREPKEKTREPKKSPIKITDETVELKSSKTERLNEKLIDLLERLSNLMSKKGEHFKSRAYKTAQETVMSFTTDITDINELKGKPGIGETIMTKFKEYMETGTLELLEREKENPENILSDIYGVGPKKAKELVDIGIRSIAELREKQDEVLNEKQKIGLRYYEDILERIPRSEIDEYKEIFEESFTKIREPDAKYEIVGSYRRGAKTSGDIDVIITSSSDKVFKEFIDLLVEKKIIIEVLSRGSHKCLVIGKLAKRKHARRIDFLYATPEEYPFSVLYFTGSKAFNTVMRGHALKMGYSLNEHEFSIMTDKKKGGKVTDVFNSEKDIFDFLKLKYKEPVERIDGRAVQMKDGSPILIELNKMIDEKIGQPEEEIDLVEEKEKTKKNNIIIYNSMKYKYYIGRNHLKEISSKQKTILESNMKEMNIEKEEIDITDTKTIPKNICRDIFTKGEVFHSLYGLYSDYITLFLEEDSDKMVGFLMFDINEKESCIFIHYLCSISNEEKSDEKKRYGEKLVEKIKDYARKAGIRELRLQPSATYDKEYLPKLIAYYEKKGFNMEDKGIMVHKISTSPPPSLASKEKKAKTEKIREPKEKKVKTEKIREPKEKKVKTEKIREPKEPKEPKVKKLTKDEEIIVLKRRAIDCETKLLNKVVSPKEKETKTTSDITPDNLPVVVSSENPILPPAYTKEPSQLNIVPINEIKKELKSKKIREPKVKTMKKKPDTKSTNTDSTPPKSKEEVIAIIDVFKTKGISVIENLSEKDLTDICELCIHYYHNMHPLITDNEYDVIRDFLDNKYPNHRLVTEIGAPIEKNKVRLPYQMASMDKIKPDSNILPKWMEKYPGPYVLSCKLDGVSGMYSTEGDDAKLYTRGDGNVGQDISHLISTMKLPKHKGYVVRGEFIIPKKVFDEKYKEKFANPRNLVSGIINSKSVDEKAKDLHFVTYEVIKPSLKPSEQMSLLTELKHEVVKNHSVSELSNEKLSELLIDWRGSYTYEIDGVIVNEDKIHPRKAGNPEHAFAFKMVLSDQMAEAKVMDVVWSASKDGYLKPRVRIEPVRLGGVTIEYATGFNGKFIEDNKIGIGAVIQLIRSGDVIPYIKSITIPATKAKMPDVPYKWTSTHVDIMLENIEDDVTVREKNITAFFTELEVDGLSGGNVKRIMTAGYDTIPKILKMDKADFNKVEGFKDKMIEKISSGIRDKVAGASLLEIMVASNLLGRGMGTRKIKPILDKYPNILTTGETNIEKIQMLRGVEGIGPENSKSFVENIPLFIAFLKECNLEGKLSADTAKMSPKGKEPEVKDTSHPLYGKKIVMTKVRDKDIIDYMKTVGATLEDGIKKDTFILIVKSHEDVSNKTKDAESKGIPIMTPEEFKEKYM
jgi:NAD-dependent DNA ligase/DNA polymerase/3'-5' exonuclease PolX